jgi:hypothetical protein
MPGPEGRVRQGRMVVGETHVVGGDRSDGAVRTTAAGGATLRVAVARLERELAEFRPVLPDRAVAEEELAELGRQAGGPPEPEQLRQSLLLVAAALGSVSRLAAPVAALREAVEQELSRQPRIAPPQPQPQAMPQLPRY